MQTGDRKAWFIDFDDTALPDEIEFLRTQIYMRDVELGVQRLTAFTLFSARV